MDRSDGNWHKKQYSVIHVSLMLSASAANVDYRCKAINSSAHLGIPVLFVYIIRSAGPHCRNLHGAGSIILRRGIHAPGHVFHAYSIGQLIAIKHITLLHVHRPILYLYACLFATRSASALQPSNWGRCRHRHTWAIDTVQRYGLL